MHTHSHTPMPQAEKHRGARLPFALATPLAEKHWEAEAVVATVEPSQPANVRPRFRHSNRQTARRCMGSHLSPPLADLQAEKHRMHA